MRKPIRLPGAFPALFLLATGFLILPSSPVLSQEQQYRFEYFGVEHGLPSGQILCIYEDRIGFLWLGTMKGLVRYDGYSFKLHRPVPGDSSSLSNPVVINIQEDLQGNLWIGTHKGLNRYDRRADSFKRYLHRPGDENSLPGNLIYSINIDSTGRLWITTDRGSGFFEPESEKFTRLQWAEKKDARSDADIFIRDIIQDNTGAYWAGSEYGILKIDSAENFVQEYHPDQYGHIQTVPLSELKNENIAGLLSFYHNYEVCYWNPETKRFFKPIMPETLRTEPFPIIIPDAAIGLWVVFRTEGVLHYRLSDQKITRFRHSPENQAGLGERLIYSVYCDRFNNLWIGGYNGLYKINMAAVKFPFFQQEPGLHKTENYIYRIYEDRQGGWWFSTYDGRLFHSETPGKPARQIFFPPGRQADIRIGTFHADSEGLLWMASNDYGPNRKHGVFTYDSRDMTLRHLDIGDTLNHCMVYYIEEDQSDRQILWIGTGVGLCMLQKNNHRRTWFYPSRFIPDLKSDNIFHTFQTPGRLWLQLGNYFNSRLGYFDKATGRFTALDISGAMPQAQNEILIRGFAQTPDGAIWIASGQGLGKLDPETLEFRLLTTRDGLAETELMGIACDQKGRLWLKGLTSVIRYHPGLQGREAFQSHPVGKDMQEFNAVGATACRDGRILLHGNNGIYAFNPDSVKLDIVRPEVVLTDFKILDHSEDLGQAPELADSIAVQFADQIITFEFAALHFLNEEHIRYKYRLEGFHEQWLDNGNDRKVSFTNLRPGGYTFRVQACNVDGFCSGKKEELAVHLRVLPPWWGTWQAVLMYLFLGFFIVYALFRFRLRQKLARAEALRLKELDRFKTRLYTNITHEFRTPLTLILGPIACSLEKNKRLTREELRVARKNCERLLQLANQILDLSKLDAGVLDAHYVQADVIPFLRYLIKSFHSFAQSRGVMLKFSSDAEQFVLDFDKEKLQTIVVNLVSNAMKFTPEGGKVAVYLECGGQFRLVVRDTGIGISPDALPFIFDRFYQAEDAARKDVGVGIGLALAKELVELMGGKIGVESEAGWGAVFIVTLPVRRTALFEEVHVPAVPAAGSKAAFPENHPPSRNKISILIIEDHPEAARYVASCLGSKFRVLFASDGARGLKLAFETVPDLIICDVMMPEKDGYEVCKILKCDERTSHIPLIMLTAKADAGSRLDGLGSGADAYLLKPFDETELRLRVEKLLELRRRLQARFHNPAECPPAGQTSSRENAFLQKIRDVTEARLTDHDFTVEALARAVGMSLPQLHRKITALTGHSAKRFIRSVRLQKARELLRATDLNISEIAYECGFGSPSHFSRDFVKIFGLSPTDFRSSLRE